MRTPKRKRPRRRAIAPPPPGIDLNELAARASYIGSPEHKSYLSAAGPGRLRSDASQCDPALGAASTFTEWLREGLRSGRVGAPWEGDFPRYVWHVHDGICYEGRLVNRTTGEYKGFPLIPEEWPSGL
jgi:hypothetical protein